jgi:hypothetical protein
MSRTTKQGGRFVPRWVVETYGETDKILMEANPHREPVEELEVWIGSRPERRKIWRSSVKEIGHLLTNPVAQFASYVQKSQEGRYYIDRVNSRLPKTFDVKSSV